MRTQARRAGPGTEGTRRPHAGSEAAGPASPRLVIEEVGIRVSPGRVEATATLKCGTRRFVGTAMSQGDIPRRWQLAAAAAVSAIQQYLQQSTADSTAPRIELIESALATTGTGQEVVHATVRLAHGSYHNYLLGSALVRNDRCSTAVAAALDATHRPLGAFRASLAPPEEPVPPESEPEAPESQPGDGDPSADSQLGSSPPVEAESPARAPALAGRAPRAKAAVGVEISAADIRAAAVDVDGRLVSTARHPGYSQDGFEVTITAAAETVQEILASLNWSGEDLGGVGVALPGRVRAEDGVCIASDQFPTWREVPLADRLSRELHTPVWLIGTTEAIALAEARFGAAKGTLEAVFVRVGADIEAAVVNGGRPLFLGDTNGGHAGHMVIQADGPRCTCGEFGCWRVMAGTEALTGRVVTALKNGKYSAMGGLGPDGREEITPALVCRMAAAGDAVAAAALEETGRCLAVGLGNLIALFDPEVVIVDGAPPSVGASLLLAAESHLKSRPRAGLLSRCVLLSAELGGSAAVMGAAAWAELRS